ncbi:MAG: hypothetical protein VX730_07750 [Pseudomonadota bacterium]|nr:hypothetical protein [Pseudomonadota bacterium]
MKRNFKGINFARIGYWIWNNPMIALWMLTCYVLVPLTMHINLALFFIVPSTMYFTNHFMQTTQLSEQESERLKGLSLYGGILSVVGTFAIYYVCKESGVATQATHDMAAKAMISVLFLYYAAYFFAVKEYEGGLTFYQLVNNKLKTAADDWDRKNLDD